MDTQATILQLQQFRQELYHLLPKRRDTLLDLLDALSSSPDAHSVVELSLSPLFRREYSSITDAVDQFFQPSSAAQAAAARRAWELKLARLIGCYVVPPQPGKFWLLGTDVVPVARPFARTLADRTFVYQPNPVGGNLPVTMGHRYSVLALLPEKEVPDAPPWVVPCVVRRVQSQEKATVVAAEQVTLLLSAPGLPFHDGLCVQVSDSAYSQVDYLGRVASQPNLVNVVRTAANRVFYRPFVAAPETVRPGPPRRYGTDFDLRQSSTWGAPDVRAETTWITRQGRCYRVALQGWHHLLMRGKRHLPMHPHPFTLIRAEVLDEQGHAVFPRPLWLIVLGARRQAVSLLDAWQAYGQRYDLEHYFRFGKQRLLLAAYQTPEVQHEENWLQLVQLATVQLWLARDLARPQKRPWERYLPRRTTDTAAPSQVQRDWVRIIGQIGTPAQPPKRRGIAPGRVAGTHPARRERHPVVKKTAQAPAKT
jgi:hypothetical protein